MVWGSNRQNCPMRTGYKVLRRWGEDPPRRKRCKPKPPPQRVITVDVPGVGPCMLLSQWEAYAGLRRLGKPVEMQWLRRENAVHVLTRPSHRFLSEGSAVDWFDFWLNGREAPDPADPPDPPMPPAPAFAPPLPPAPPVPPLPLARGSFAAR